MDGGLMRQRLVDGAAIAASFACLVHCLALPVLFILIPTAAAFVGLPESFHRWALAFALVTSGIAMAMGVARHRALAPVLWAVLGLALIAFGVLLAPSAPIETIATVIGALALAIGHALNWRAAAERDQSAKA